MGRVPRATNSMPSACDIDAIRTYQRTNRR
jgi:hypothetical protein